MTTRKQKLDLLHKKIRACIKCKEAGYWIVEGAVVRGVHTAKVMTIGQAPGPTEAIVKRPFNAGSGKRLFAWLCEAGFDEDTFRATQYMTSITKCYPGKGKGGGGDRVPSKEEQEFCRVWLDQEIESVSPKLIIPIGRLAISLFFDIKLPLEKIVGKQIERDGRIIIPLHHPSGASTWHQKEANRALVKKAIRLIAKQKRRLGC